MSSETRNITLLKPKGDASETFSDTILLAACAQGDINALGTLFDRHQLALYRFITSLVSPDTADVDDMATEHVYGRLQVRAPLLGPLDCTELAFRNRHQQRASASATIRPTYP